jgi:hypothetical protein
MNIHLSTEFKTEDKYEFNLAPVTSGKLRFKVRAPNDAHVALTTGPAEGYPMYEVSNMIVYLKTHNDHFVFSPGSHSVFVTIINVCICGYVDTLSVIK